MALAWLKCDADILEVFHIIDTIISGKENTALILFTANQAGTDHKVNFQLKHPARAKLAAINNNNSCCMGEVRWRQFGSI